MAHKLICRSSINPNSESNIQPHIGQLARRDLGVDPVTSQDQRSFGSMSDKNCIKYNPITCTLCTMQNVSAYQTLHKPNVEYTYHCKTRPAQHLAKESYTTKALNFQMKLLRIAHSLNREGIISIGNIASSSRLFIILH